jgi:hypothetical protein
METLSNILASFDIFQILLNIFPPIFTPLAEAFRNIFTVLADTATKQFAAHPGLISGTIVFLLGYVAWNGIIKLRSMFFSTRPVSGSRSI